MSALRNIQIGGSSKSKPKSGAGQHNASEKELQKLRRMDLLELLIDQVRENEKLNASVEELTDLSDRLKGKLDDKDAQIEHLKRRLDAKDAQISELLEQNRTMAHAVNTFDINEIIEVQRTALEKYFEGLSDTAPEQVDRVAHNSDEPFKYPEPLGKKKRHSAEHIEDEEASVEEGVDGVEPSSVSDDADEAEGADESPEDAADDGIDEAEAEPAEEEAADVPADEDDK